MTLVWINVADYPIRRMQRLGYLSPAHQGYLPAHLGSLPGHLGSLPAHFGNLLKNVTAIPGADVQVQA